MTLTWTCVIHLVINLLIFIDYHLCKVCIHKFWNIWADCFLTISHWIFCITYSGGNFWFVINNKKNCTWYIPAIFSFKLFWTEDAKTFYPYGTVIQWLCRRHWMQNGGINLYRFCARWVKINRSMTDVYNFIDTISSLENHAI